MDTYASQCCVCDEWIIFNRDQPSSGIDFSRRGKYFAGCSVCVESYVVDRQNHGDDADDYVISDRTIENHIIRENRVNRKEMI